MTKRMLYLSILLTLLLSACGTLDVSIQKDATATVSATLPAVDPTKYELEIAATSMSAFVTQQAATLYPASPTPPAGSFDPLSPWKVYQNDTFGFSLEYPITYDMDPYGATCGLQVNNEELRLGHQISLSFLYSGGLGLEEYTDQLLQQKDWRVETRRNGIVSGLDAITVDYRFGGTDRFGTMTLVEYNSLVFAFQFLAGDFCVIPGLALSEPEVYDHMIQTFQVLGVQASPTPPTLTGEVDPILVFPPHDSRSGFLLGGSKNGEWLNATNTASLLKGEESYAIYMDNVLLGYGMGTAPSQNPPFCPNMQEVSLYADNPFKSVVALSTEWNALPRRPVEISTDNDIYQQVIFDLLQANGIRQPEVRLNRVIKVDLEGDGVDEIVISASRFKDASGHDAAVGDYSLVLVRKVNGDEVLSIPLITDFYLQSSPSSFPDHHLLTAVLDLNGSGSMEVVVSLAGWEQTGAMAFEVGVNSARQVLDVRCPE